MRVLASGMSCPLMTTGTGSSQQAAGGRISGISVGFSELRACQMQLKYSIAAATLLLELSTVLFCQSLEIAAASFGWYEFLLPAVPVLFVELVEFTNL